MRPAHKTWVSSYTAEARTRADCCEMRACGHAVKAPGHSADMHSSAHSDRSHGVHATSHPTPSHAVHATSHSAAEAASHTAVSTTAAASASERGRSQGQRRHHRAGEK